MMVLRKLAVALLSAGVMLPGLGHALAVKELQTKSALGEPFQAEVELIELGDLNADEIKVNLASQEDFDRMGIDRVYFLTDLKFNVVVNQGGRSYISITSAKPVVEPYLDFVVRIAWPGNARLQEVTALLDPPMMVDSAAPDVAAPVGSAPAAPAAIEPPPLESAPVEPVAPEVPAAEPPRPVITEEKKPEPVTAPEPKPVAPAPAAPASQPAPTPDAYKVQAGDTMSGIAERFRTGDATIHQAMIAIQRANPKAFASDNVNQVKRGHVLRIPSESQMREISAREAVASVREQTEAWRASAAAPAVKPALEGRQLDATAKVPATEAAPAPEGKPEMKILGAQSGKAGAAAAGKDQAVTAKPEEARKLAELKTLTQNAQVEKQKHAGKVETLDAKVKANDKQIDVQNARLAELDARLKEAKAKEEAAKAANAAAPAPSQPAEAAKPEAATPAPQAPEAAPATPPVEAAKPAPVEPSSPASAKPKAVVVEEPVDEASPLPLLAGGIAALLAVLGGGWWWNQRRRREQAEAEAALADLEADTTSDLSDAAFQQEDVAAQGDSWQDSDWLNEPATAPATDRVLADPLEEAQQYIAYERYPQAAGLLKKAIDSSPERADLRMKLIEVCAHMDDWNGVAEQADWFEAAGDLEAVARAEELKAGMTSSASSTAGDSLEGDGLDFVDYSGARGTPAAAHADELPSLEDLEMDFNAGVSASSPALEAVKDTDLEGMDLDFAELESDLAAPARSEPAADDLSFELDTAAFETSQPAAGATADEEFDFSLDESVPATSAGNGLGELEDFENLPDLAPVEEAPAAAKSADDDLSFSLDDLELSAAEDASGLDQAFSLEEDLEAPAAKPAEFSLDDSAVAGDDFAMDFDATMKSEPESISTAPASEPAVTDAGFGMDDEFDFLADTDENATKLDLARAYIDMGDMEGARDILQEVMSEGNPTQKDEAKGLLAQVG